MLRTKWSKFVVVLLALSLVGATVFAQVQDKKFNDPGPGQPDLLHVHLRIRVSSTGSRHSKASRTRQSSSASRPCTREP